jgi:hypothetical protein
MHFMMRNNTLDVTINDQAEAVAFDRQRWFGYRHVCTTIDRIRRKTSKKSAAIQKSHFTPR